MVNLDYRITGGMLRQELSKGCLFLLALTSTDSKGAGAYLRHKQLM
jgi:hypothetical protein